jgi:NAD(P)H-flavin reductase
VGSVSSVLYNMNVGDKVGLRGPFGRAFPYEALLGRNLLFVGSGVALAPLRTILTQVVKNKSDFGRVVVMASALQYEKLIYKEELKLWNTLEGVEVHYALKHPTDQVKAYTGYLNDLLPDLGLDWKNTTALVCASPERIKKVSKDLLALGMRPTDILMTLETHMRCGAGKCGHCKVGSHYMCVDGPVFNYEEMMALPPEY